MLETRNQLTAILPCPAGRDSPGRHLLFLTGPRDSGSDPGRPAQLFGAGLLSLGVPFYCIEITSEKMRGWLRVPHPFRMDTVGSYWLERVCFGGV
jgi:hypothetical protein